MIQPNILVLVLHSEAEPWRTIAETQRETWIASSRLECLHYVGGASCEHLDGCTLRLPAAEGRLDRLGIKTAMAFDWALRNREFDFVYRTNTSSYVDTAMLSQLLASKQRSRYYAGYHNPSYGGFASGCGYALSRDCAKIVAADRRVAAAYPDDVAVAKLLQSHGITHEHLQRMDLETQQQLDAWRSSGRQRCFHYRCKGAEGTRPGWDCAVMREVHEAVNKQA